MYFFWPGSCVKNLLRRQGTTSRESLGTSERELRDVRKITVDKGVTKKIPNIPPFYSLPTDFPILFPAM